MSDKPERGPRLPPRWFIRLAWSVHRGLYRVTGGRVGLRRPRGNRWGTLRLTTMGRRTGRKHSVIIAYLEDGPNLIAMAMNGWADGEPAWWLNLQARPDASVDLVDGPRPVRARVARGDERSRLWGRWREIDAKLDAYAAVPSPRQTAVDWAYGRPKMSTTADAKPGKATRATRTRATRPTTTERRSRQAATTMGSWLASTTTAPTMATTRAAVPSGRSSSNGA